jgi:hypothetical protein
MEIFIERIQEGFFYFVGIWVLIYVYQILKTLGRIEGYLGRLVHRYAPLDRTDWD